MLASNIFPRPGITRRLFTPDDVTAIEQRLRTDRLLESDRQFLERLQEDQPPTIHTLERFRLDDLLREGE